MSHNMREGGQLVGLDGFGADQRRQGGRALVSRVWGLAGHEGRLGAP